MTVSNVSIYKCSADSYFEVKILDLEGTISIGIVHSKHSLTEPPGHDNGSWGLVSATGELVYARSAQIADFCPPFRSGDTVGCGVANFQVFWTINGEFVGFARNKLLPDVDLCPAIGVNGRCKYEYNLNGKLRAFMFEVYRKKTTSVLFSLHTTQPPKERYCPTLCLTGETLLVFGGRSRYNGVMNDTYSLHLISKVWTKIDVDESTLPPKMYGHTATLLDIGNDTKYMLVYGGRTIGWNRRWHTSKDLWALDLKQKRWTCVNTTHPPVSRYGHVVELVGRRLYVFGGYCKESNTLLSDMHSLNLSNVENALHKTEWTTIAPNTPAPSPRYGHSSVYFDGKIFIFGGANRQHDLAELYEYTIETKAWRKPPTSKLTPCGRFHHAVALMGSRMVILGGCRRPDETVLTDIWTLNLIPDANGLLKWEKAFAEVEPNYGLCAIPAYGHKKLYAKFVHYAEWSDAPRSPSESTPGVLMFGGAADIGLNGHPRKISNAVRFLIPFETWNAGRRSSTHLLDSASSSSSESPVLLRSAPASATSPDRGDPKPPPRSSSKRDGSLLGSLPEGTASPRSEKSSPPSSQKSSTKSAPIDSDEDLIALKCFNGNDIRMLSVSGTIKFSKLVKKIQREYETQDVLLLKYKDSDGDLVTLSKPQDLRMAIAAVRREDSGPIKVHIFSQNSLPQKTTSTRRSDSSPALELPSAVANGSLAYNSEWQIPASELVFTNKKLGRGFFGEVVKAEWRGVAVACKAIYRESFHSKHEEELFLHECAVMSRLRHPKICLFLGVSFDDDNKYLVMEFMSGGSLFSAIHNANTRQTILTPQLMFAIALDIVQALIYLHGKLIFHRDLTSKNVLLDSFFMAKLADFGLAKLSTATSNSFGAVPFMAPEVLAGGEYTSAADIYSFGMILYEMWTGKDVYDLKGTALQHAERIKNGYRPDLGSLTCPGWYKTLIENCWEARPEQRPTLEQILALLKKMTKDHGTLKLGTLPSSLESDSLSESQGGGSDSEEESSAPIDSTDYT